MSNKTVSTRIDSSTEQFLIENFGTVGSGLSQAAETLQQVYAIGRIENLFNVDNLIESLYTLNQIRLYSSREIKGVFTENEWKYMADMMNGITITPDFRANNGALIAGIEDANSFRELGNKWDVDVPKFIEKVKKLTGAQVDAVFTHCLLQ